MRDNMESIIIEPDPWREDMQALVFTYAGGATSTAIALTPDDERTLLELLQRRAAEHAPEFDPQTWPIDEVWVLPDDTDGANAAVYLGIIGGPKRYVRLPFIDGRPASGPFNDWRHRVALASVQVFPSPHPPTREQIDAAVGAEPTVQVPVSLIERIRRDYSVKNLGPNIVDALDALLSQSTPTAEHHDLCATRIPGMGIPGLEGVPQPCNCHLFLPEPPRIEDMASGTTFSAQDRTGRRRYWRRAPGGVEVWWHPKWQPSSTRDIDPSTIRDVTPPTS